MGKHKGSGSSSSTWTADTVGMGSASAWVAGSRSSPHSSNHSHSCLAAPSPSPPPPPPGAPPGAWVGESHPKERYAPRAKPHDRNGITPGDCSALMSEIGTYFDRAAAAVA